MSNTSSSSNNHNLNNFDKINSNNLNEHLANIENIRLTDKKDLDAISLQSSINIIENNTSQQIYDQNNVNEINENNNDTVQHQDLDNVPTSLPPTYWNIPGTVPISAGTVNGPPPTYEEVINPNVPPPTYQSLFGQVQNARKTAKTLSDLIKKLTILILGTIGLTFLIAFTILVPFTMILVGANNLNNCPAENIPVFLLIGGIVWIIKNLSSHFSQCSKSTRELVSAPTNNISSNNNLCNRSYSQNDSCSLNSSNVNNNQVNLCIINLGNDQPANECQHNRIPRCNLFLNCFIFSWFLTGCIMVYRIYPPNFVDQKDSNYCDRAVYFYAFWLLTSIFIIFGLFISFICCISITALFSSNSEICIRR